LEWLMFNPSQRVHALLHSNTLARRFILDRKIAAAREVLAALPTDSVALVKQSWAYHKKKSWEANAVREHLSLSAFLSAVASYDGWAHIFYKKPVPPPPLHQGSQPSQEIAWVQLQGEYQEAHLQWKEKAVKKADEALSRLSAVLSFPCGWLKDESGILPSDTPSAVTRAREMEELRRASIPQVFLLSHTVLHETCQYQECMKLANLVADEGASLYKDFSAEELRGLLSLLAKSAMASVLANQL